MSIPNTATRTDHAISIHANGGPAIARIQDWQPAMARAITPLYELNSANTGEVIENVPGNIQGLQITVNRVDLFSAKMEQVWGPNFNIQMLTDQNNPLTIKEKWKNPDGTTEVWIYTGCWFASLGRSHSVTGDRIVRVNATLNYVKKYQAA